jgi:hypothetical protein
MRQYYDTNLDKGVKRIYPAHGKPFSADIMKKLCL